MTLFCIQKPRFTSIFITLLIALQISACTTEDNLAAETNGTSRTTDTGTNTNRPAIITGNSKGNLTEDATSGNTNLLEVSGTLFIADRDVGESGFIEAVVNGNYGSLVIGRTGNWVYSTNNDQTIIQNLTDNSKIIDKLTVISIDGTTHTIVITINGINEVNSPAVFIGMDSGSVTEDLDPDSDNLLEVGGILKVIDSDAGEAGFVAKIVNGNYGILTIYPAGNWSYAANNNQNAIQNLVSGAALIDNLIVNSFDGTPHTIVIVINGINEANSPAIITGTDSGNVTEDNDPDADNLLETSGKLNITDSDANQAAFIAKTVNSNYGSLTINTAGSWSYAANNNQAAIQNLDNGATLVDSFITSSIDGTTHTIVIVINGINEANSPAIITGTDSGNVTEDNDPDADNLLETSGKLNITDSDTGEAAFIAKTVNGNYGNLTINTAGNWNYAANNNQAAIQNLDSSATLTDNLTIISVDGTTHIVGITINGANEVNNPAVITGTDSGSVTEDIDPDSDNLLEASGTLNITDSDADEAAFIAKTVNGNYGSLTINTAGNWNYAANNNQTAIQDLVSGTTLNDSLVINSVDGTAHTISITLLGADENTTLTDITLSWVAPAEREDNSALSLSAIAGYKVYYGTSQGQYANSITINDSDAVGYTIVDLPAGTYYLVVTTIDTDGRESQQSSEVNITL